MRNSICFVTMLGLFSAANTIAATKTYTIPDALTVAGLQGGSYTYGISAPVIDHSMDGQTITIHSIAVEAQGNARGPRINFDWQFWFDNAPLGLPSGGMQTGPDYLQIAAITAPASYSTGWHFIDGDVLLPAVGNFGLQGNYDFASGAAFAAPAYGGTASGISGPMSLTDGLHFQVAGWSGDSSAASSGVDFTMSDITVTIDYTVVAQAEAISVPVMRTWALVLLTTLIAIAGWFGLRRWRHS